MGTSLYVPGASAQEVVIRTVANSIKPSDGQNYPLVTKAGWQIRCLPSLQNARTSGLIQGEGFLAVSPSGVT
jgi:hypothetical protein